MREELLRIVAGLQSARDRMINALTPRFGEAFDGDFDAMLEAINALKKAAAENWKDRYFDRRAVISRWNEQAVALGYDGVAHLLDEAAPPSQPVALLHPENGAIDCPKAAAVRDCTCGFCAAMRKVSQPAALPPDWVAVPREPTEEMVDRVIDFANEHYAHDMGAAMVYSLLRDVIDFAAAPEVPRG